jgi:hypothetical protein
MVSYLEAMKPEILADREGSKALAASYGFVAGSPFGEAKLREFSDPDDVLPDGRCPFCGEDDWGPADNVWGETFPCRTPECKAMAYKLETGGVWVAADGAETRRLGEAKLTESLHVCDRCGATFGTDPSAEVEWGKKLQGDWYCEYCYHDAVQELGAMGEDDYYAAADYQAYHEGKLKEGFDIQCYPGMKDDVWQELTGLDPAVNRWKEEGDWLFGVETSLPQSEVEQVPGVELVRWDGVEESEFERSVAAYLEA